MKKYLLSTLTTLLLAQTAFADVDPALLAKAKLEYADAQYQVAKQYCSEGNYKEGIYWLEEQVKQGDRWAMGELGDAYYYGTCSSYNRGKQQFTPNYVKAIEWYERGGYTFNVAEIYWKGGYGVKQDRNKAIIIYRSKAGFDPRDRNGSISCNLACYRLAQVYYFGLFGYQQSDKYAYEWASRAWDDRTSFPLFELSMEGVYAGIMKAHMDFNKRGKGKKWEGLELMEKICKEYKEKRACDWVEDMKADRPLRKAPLQALHSTKTGETRQFFTLRNIK